MRALISQRLFWVAILLFLSLPTVLPLFHRGFFISDDGEWMIIRLSAFFEALGDGQLPVRFLSRLNHGYGYPVVNFLYPGFLYLGSIIHLFGFGFVDSIKIILGASLLGSSVFAFLWLRRHFKILPAIIGALVYLYMPYHLFDTYTRGSVGEVLALAIIPLTLWAIKTDSLIFSSVAYGLLILSHNTLAILTTPLLVTYTLIESKRLFPAYLLGLGLSSFFWLPALYERKLVIFDDVIVSSWGEYFLKDYSLIGWTGVIILILAVALVTNELSFPRSPLGKLSSHPRGGRYSQTWLGCSTSRMSPGVRGTCFFLFFSLAAIFMALPVSTWLWRLLPLGKLIQFPWRFLSLTLPSLAYLSAWLFNKGTPYKFAKGLAGGLLIIIFISLLVLDAKGELNKISFIDKGEDFYRTNEATTTVHGEYMPRWVLTFPTNRPPKKVELLGRGKVDILSLSTNRVNAVVEVQEESIFQVNTVYYPGWQAWINNQIVPINFNNPQGLIHLPVPPGKHRIKVSFGETGFRMMSNQVSFISIAVLLGICWVRRKKRNG